MLVWQHYTVYGISSMVEKKISLKGCLNISFMSAQNTKRQTNIFRKNHTTPLLHTLNNSNNSRTLEIESAGDEYYTQSLIKA